MNQTECESSHQRRIKWIHKVHTTYSTYATCEWRPHMNVKALVTKARDRSFNFSLPAKQKRLGVWGSFFYEFYAAGESIRDETLHSVGHWQLAWVENMTFGDTWTFFGKNPSVEISYSGWKLRKCFFGCDFWGRKRTHFFLTFYWLFRGHWSHGNRTVVLIKIQFCNGFENERLLLLLVGTFHLTNGPIFHYRDQCRRNVLESHGEN